MKFTLPWLKDHLDTSTTLPEIRAKLDHIARPPNCLTLRLSSIDARQA